MDLAAGRDEVADPLAELNKRMQGSLPASLAGPERHTIHTAAQILGICEVAQAALPPAPNNYFGPAASACPHRIGDDGAPLPGRGSQPAIASAAP